MPRQATATSQKPTVTLQPEQPKSEKIPITVGNAGLVRLLSIAQFAAARADNLVVSGDAIYTASTVRDIGEIVLWETAAKQRGAILKGHNGTVKSIAFSPDGRLLASGGVDSTVRLWDAASGRSLFVLNGHQWDVQSVAFSPDGRLLASGGGDGTVRLWEVASGKPITVLEGHEWDVRSVAFSPDGKRLASTSADDIRLWEVATGKQLHLLKDEKVFLHHLVMFSPDGKLIASGNSEGVWLWDAATGTPRVRLDHFFSIEEMAFSPDGTVLVTSTFGRQLRVWDVINAKILTAREQQSDVVGIQFSPDGSRLFVGTDKNAVQEWGVPAGWWRPTATGSPSKP
jgi:WD40 repeat protein